MPKPPPAEMVHSGIQAPVGRARLALALLLASLAVLGPLNVDMYLPAFPAIADGLGATESQTQLSLTACLIGLAVGQVVIGPFSDAAGRKRPLVGFLLGFVAASLCCAVAPNITALIAGRFFQGFTASAGVVLSRAVARDLFSGRDLTTFYSLLMAINATAPLVAPMAGGAILLLPFADWHIVFWFLAGIGAVILVVSSIGVAETLPVAQRIPTRARAIAGSMGILLRQRVFCGYTIIMGAVHGGSFAYVAGTPFVYQEMYGVSPQTFSVLFGINGLAIVAGSFVVGRLGPRFGDRAVLRCAVTVAAVATGVVLVTAVLHGPLAVLVVALFGYMTCMGMILTGVFALAMSDQGERAGAASAVLGALPMLVGASVAPLVGLGGNPAIGMGTILFGSAGVGLLGYLFLVARAPRATRTTNGLANG